MKGELQCATPAQGAALRSGDQLVEEVQNYSNVENHHPMMELPRYVTEALFVADLHPSAEEHAGSLHELFSQIGTVASIRVRKPADAAGKPPFCSAYINFLTVEDACRAWQTLNYHIWMGMPMRIMFSNLDPATRYDEKANIIVMNLAQSIDSEALHHTFCIFGVVLSCKVELDLRGRSTGRGFIQFQDEEDAERAIRMVNNKMLEDKVVCVGRFIRRTFSPQVQDQMNKNAIDLNPAHETDQAHSKVDVPSASLQVVQNRSQDINLKAPKSSAAIGSPDTSIASGSTSNSISATRSRGDDELVPSARQASRNFMLRRWSSAERNMARRRAIMGRKLKDMLRIEEDICEDSQVDKVDPAHFPSSEPWPPQPWSVAILKEMLGKAHLPEERRAMLGATFLPLVAKHTSDLATDITNELVTLGLKEAVRVMRLSEDALRERVEVVKRGILARIKTQAPFVPATTQVLLPAPAIAEASAFDEKRVEYTYPTSCNATAAGSVEEQAAAEASFAVPVVPEFLEAVAANEPTMALFPLSPRFPDSVLGYAYRPGLGTGFFEPLRSGTGDTEAVKFLEHRSDRRNNTVPLFPRVRRIDRFLQNYGRPRRRRRAPTSLFAFIS